MRSELAAANPSKQPSRPCRHATALPRSGELQRIRICRRNSGSGARSFWPSSSRSARCCTISAGRRLPTRRPPPARISASPSLLTPGHGVPSAAAVGLFEQAVPQASAGPRGRREEVDRYLRLLPTRTIHARDHPREALQRVRAQRQMRERLAARPRQAKLGTRHLYRPLAALYLRLLEYLCLHPIEHTERGLDRWQRALGYAERVPHPSFLIGVQKHAHRSRPRVQPATDRSPYTR